MNDRGCSFEDYMHHATLKRVAWCGGEYWQNPPGRRRLLLVAGSFYDREGAQLAVKPFGITFKAPTVQVQGRLHIRLDSSPGSE